jgi:hypothetical protein
METNNKDKMLKNYFDENKIEIADNGFSNRVMRQLPNKANKDWIVWVFAAIGMMFSLYFGLSTGLIQNILLVITKIPIYYFLAGVFSFPLLGSAGYFYFQKEI